MANFVQQFREEVTRLTRRAISAELGQLKKAGAQHRRDIAALKRVNAKLGRKVSFLEKQEAKRVAGSSAELAGKETIRYSPSWLRKHRKKLGFSAADYAQLVGASAQSIYLWEQGKTKPRESQLVKLAAVRGMGRRDAEARLALMNKKK